MILQKKMFGTLQQKCIATYTMSKQYIIFLLDVAIFLSTLYNENCNVICSPDGGLTGSGDGQCSDFFDTRTDEKLIWEDVR